MRYGVAALLVDAAWLSAMRAKTRSHVQRRIRPLRDGMRLATAALTVFYLVQMGVRIAWVGLTAQP
jgi:hypothetical protein